MWEGGHVDDRLIITKHVAGAFHRHTEAAQGHAQINDLLCACARRNILRSESSSLDGRLQLSEPVNRRLVEEMQDASIRSSTDQIVVEVSISEGGSDDALAERGRSIKDVFSLGTTITREPTKVRYKRLLP